MPWALSPLISTMPHFAHARLYGSPESCSSSSKAGNNGRLQVPNRGAMEETMPSFPPKHSVSDDLSSVPLLNSHDDYLLGSDLKSLPRSVSSPSLAPNMDGNRGSLKKKLSNVSLHSGRSSPGPEASVRSMRSAQQRRSHFQSATNRKKVVFGPDVSDFHVLYYL